MNQPRQIISLQLFGDCWITERVHKLRDLINRVRATGLFDGGPVAGKDDVDKMPETMFLKIGKALSRRLMIWLALVVELIVEEIALFFDEIGPDRSIHQRYRPADINVVRKPIDPGIVIRVQFEQLKDTQFCLR